MDEFEIIATEMRILGKRPRTIHDYRIHSKNMCKINGIEYIDEITRDCLLKFISYTKQESISDVSKQTRLRCMKAILNRFLNKGLIELNFWKDISVTVNTEIKEGTTEQEVFKLISLLDFSNYAQFRDATAILLLWETGVRLGSLAGLESHMIDYETHIINFSGAIMKNHRALKLPISEELCEMLSHLIECNEMIKNRNDVETDLVFLTQNGNSISHIQNGNVLTKRISDYKREFGLQNISAHNIRRGFARRLLDNDVSLPIISKALNHSSVEVTSKYLYIDNDEVIDAIKGTWNK